MNQDLEVRGVTRATAPQYKSLRFAFFGGPCFWSWFAVWLQSTQSGEQSWGASELASMTQDFRGQIRGHGTYRGGFSYDPSPPFLDREVARVVKTARTRLCCGISQSFASTIAAWTKPLRWSVNHETHIAMARPLSFPRPSSHVLIFLLATSAPGRQMTASASLAAFTPGPSPRGLIRPRPVSLHSRGPPQATSVLDLRASMKDYRKSLVQDKVDRLERMTRSVFQLQDALLQLSTFEKRGGPEEVAQKQIEQPQPKPTSCVVVGTGPAGLATAIMLAR